MFLLQDHFRTSNTHRIIVAVITTNITSSQAQDLACTFVKWFYEMINGCSGGKQPSATEFRPDHFFADADAKIAIQASASDASQPGGNLLSQI